MKENSLLAPLYLPRRVSPYAEDDAYEAWRDRQDELDEERIRDLDLRQMLPQERPK